MNYKDVTVASRVSGEVVTAKLLTCDECGGDQFLVLLVGDPGHPHLQCLQCDTTHCQGDCGGARELEQSMN